MSKCPYCHGNGYDASGLVCTCVNTKPLSWKFYVISITLILFLIPFV
jgi:hypothetical protein